MSTNRDNKGRFAAKSTKRKTSQLDRIEDRISKIESSLAVIRSGATFMQQLEAPLGLQHRDYCEASKEVADALIAMRHKRWVLDDGIGTYICWDGNSKDWYNYSDRMDTLLDPSEFLRRANVTANELGLKPVKKPWVPKVGDLVKCISTPAALDAPASIGTVVRLWDGFKCEVNGVGWAKCSDKELFYSAKHLRPATPEEIAAHEAATKEEQQRKEKIAKMVFGTRVEFQDDKGWRVCVDKPLSSSYYAISKSGTSQTALAQADQLTIID